MKIKNIEVRQLKIPLKYAFQVSKNIFNHVYPMIIKIETIDGLVGYGESPCLNSPWYVPETFQTANIIVKEHVIPSIMDQEILNIDDFHQKISWIQGNRMAVAGVDAAMVDIFAQMEDKSLSAFIGGKKKYVEAGCSEGIQKQPQELIRRIEKKVHEGYKRVKVKIQPGDDVEVIKNIRKEFPKLKLMVDANSAYTLDDLAILKALDRFDLLMIEQPLANGDLIEHAAAQKELNTAICLDESIHSLHDVQLAHLLKACKVINIKPPRVGGPWTAIKIHNYCEKHNIPVWVGGMIETGIGRFLNVAIASLPNFKYPGDLTPPTAILKEDIIENEMIVEDGLIRVPTGRGIGISVSQAKLEKYTIKKEYF